MARYFLAITLIVAMTTTIVLATSEDDPYFPGFHFRPPANWINDPNGPMLYNGVYHLFYQYNPTASVWGNMNWGHAVSYDLLNWKDLPIALAPTEPYNKGGVFSGSATITKDGPILDFAVQAGNCQGVAVPKNITDPFLVDWEYPEYNPVIPKAPTGLAGFRDPTEGWQDSDGNWNILIGGGEASSGVGGALLYRSSDMWQTWDYEGYFYKDTGIGNMWECPDFFPIPGSEEYTDDNTPLWLIKASSCNGNIKEWWSVGEYSSNTNNIFRPSLAAMGEDNQMYDYGKFYASKTFLDTTNNQRVLWGFVGEMDSQDASVARGWANMMNVPRAVTCEAVTNCQTIANYPITQFNTLRFNEATFNDVAVAAGASTMIHSLETTQGDLELTVDTSQFEAGKNYQFGVYMMATEDLAEYTSIYVSLTATANGFEYSFSQDLAKSSTSADAQKITISGPVTVYTSEEQIQLRVIVDHSIIEAFVQQGRRVITSRVYPVAGNSATAVFVANEGENDIVFNSVEVYDVHATAL